MNQITTATIAAPNPRRRRRWPWVLLVLVVVFVGFPALLYVYIRWAAAGETATALAETDQLDPDWRWADIDAGREKLADEENAAVQIIKVVISTGRGGMRFKNSQASSDAFERLEPQFELNGQQVDMLREAFEGMQEGVALARKLKDMPKGRFRLNVTPDFFSTMINDQQSARGVFDILQHDAMLRTQIGDLDGAVESCRACMNAGRAIGDEPILISFLIRAAGVNMALQALERALAQGRPTEAALQPMQELLEQEIVDVQKHWVSAMRGERAGHEVLMRALNDGKVRPGALAMMLGGSNAGVVERIVDYFPALVTRDYPPLLRHMNQVVEAAKGPLEVQQERFRELDQSTRKSAILVRLIAPAVTNVSRANLRTQALLRSALAAVACERYRLRDQEGRWPRSLAELEKAGLLAATPTDPYDGAELRFRPWKERIVIYAIGLDRTDDGGHIDRRQSDQPGVDVGFRLWNLTRRRQPPQPPIVLAPGQ